MEAQVETAWHTMPGEAVLAQLGVQRTTGLTEAQVQEQRRVHGTNKLSEGHGRSALAIIAGQVFNGLTAILLAVFAIAVVNEEWVEAVVVVLVITLNSSIGAWQEIKSEVSMSAIRHLATKSQATVLRDGSTTAVAVEDLVLGDIVELRQGQQVPADLRLLVGEKKNE